MTSTLPESASDLLDRTWREALRPETELTVSQYADRFRVIHTGPAPGRYRSSLTPYLVEIMDRFSASDPTEEIVGMKGSQIGFTDGVANNVIAYSIEHDPSSILFMSASLELSKYNVDSRLQPMVEATPALADRILSWSKTRIRFRGGEIHMRGANSTAGLRSISVQKGIWDEIDGYEREIGQEGDPISISERRLDAFEGRRKKLKFSTPTVKDYSRIEDAYNASDMRRYFVPCPHCGTMDWIRWENVKWETDAPATAQLQCVGLEGEGCGELIDEQRYKPQMLARGEWRATAKKPSRVAGYHISALYSPWKSWATCVDEFLKSKDDPSLLRVWVNTVLAETFEERADSADGDTVYERREAFPIDSSWPGEWKPILVPKGVGVLVCATDVHGNRLETIVRGYGVGEQSWLISFRIFDGDPAVRDGESVWRQLDQYLRTPFTHADSGKKLYVESATVDAGGHHSDEVYQFTKARAMRRVGNVIQRVNAVHGGRKIGQPVVGRPEMRNKYRAKNYEICSDTAKGTIVARLRVEHPGPGYVHLPDVAWCDLEYCEQLTSEKRIWKREGGRIKRKWDQTRERNEAFDLEQYALAALRILGPELIRNLNVRAARWSERPKLTAPGPEASPLERLAALKKKRGWMERWKR